MYVLCILNKQDSATQSCLNTTIIVKQNLYALRPVRLLYHPKEFQLLLQYMFKNHSTSRISS